MPERAPLHRRSDPDLEAALADLREAVAWPTAAPAAPSGAPDLATRVRVRIEAAPRAREVGRGLRPVRRGLVLALAAVLLLVAVAAAVGLGLPGLRILFAPGPPPAVPPSTPAPSGVPGPLGSDLGLGEPVDPSRIAGRLGFEPVLPADPSLGPPERAYLAGGRLTLVYPARPGLPPTLAPGIGLLVTEFEGRVDGGWLEKSVHQGSTVEPLTVHGQPGYWITGAPHFLLYEAPNGAALEESRRIVGDVLIWREGDLTIRLETALGRDATLRLAENMGGVP